jgi:hypothetical protein
VLSAYDVGQKLESNQQVASAIILLCYIALFALRHYLFSLLNSMKKVISEQATKLSSTNVLKIRQ